ncbi:VOC family protein [Gordonia aurantiaca]|uniref:VOC family protein n=1 Tax=Gordonia sp. B21 TaxID=3151852 RepID=UPI00326673DD
MIPPISSSTAGPTVVIELACADAAATAGAHGVLLGLDAADPSMPIVVGNTELRLGDREPGTDVDRDGAHRVYFSVDDLPAALRLLTRRGFPLTETGIAAVGEPTPLGVAGPSGIAPVPAGDITGMDHLVFMSDDRDRAVALFGGVFGLDFRLDQPIGDTARQLFFRADDLIVEVVTGTRSPDAPPMPAAATLWGVAWRAPDIEATHARLTAAGLDLSEIRVGRKKGTRIFTVRERSLGTRTVVIGPA